MTSQRTADVDAVQAKSATSASKQHAHHALDIALMRGAFPDAIKDAALTDIAAGRDKADIARELAIGPWLEHIDPKALLLVEPRDLLEHPLSPDFAARITSLIPPTIEDQAILVRIVRVAHQYGDEGIALWAARRIASDYYDLDLWAVALMAAYLYTRDSTTIPARRLIMPTRTLAAAEDMPTVLRGAITWLSWMIFDVMFGPEGMPDTWRPAGTFLGIDIVPLNTPVAVFDAAHYYDNCVGYYAPLFLADTSRVFELRQDGRRIGLAEVRMGGIENAFPNPYQLKGPHGQSLGRHELQAVYGMLYSPPAANSRGAARGHAFPQSNVLTERWGELIATTYLRERKGELLFPRAITKESLTTMLRKALAEKGLAHLGRILGEETVLEPIRSRRR